MLKPAYSFGGIPIIQKAKPYIDNWLNMRQNVQDYAQSLSMYVLSTNIEALLAGNQNDPSVIARADAFNRFRRAKGLLLTDKENEELSSVSLSVAGVDRFLAQAQEHCAGGCPSAVGEVDGHQPERPPFVGWQPRHGPAVGRA